MDRKGVRNALAWLVARNIIDVRRLPAPGEEIVTARGKPTAKSGVKQYRLLTERQQIARIARRATPAERDRATLQPSPARQAARERLAQLRQNDLVVDLAENAELRE
jgi:hypothetical protein